MLKDFAYYSSDEYYEAVHRQWLDVVERNDTSIDVVRPEVLEVWNYLIQKGVSSREYNPTFLPQDVFQKILEDNKLLLECTVPFLDSLYFYVPQTSAMFIVFDKNGIPMDVYLLSDDDSAYNYYSQVENNICKGMDQLSTIAFAVEIGICLKTKKVSWACSEENYMEAAKDWSCVCAPVLDDDGELYGMISLSERNKDASSHHLALISAIATAIGNELNLKKKNAVLQEKARQLNDTLEAMPSGVLALDDKNMIISANTKASRMLVGTADPMKLIGRKIDDIIISKDDILRHVLLRSSPGREVNINTSSGISKLFIESICYEKWNLILLREPEYQQKIASNIASSHAYFRFSDIIGSSQKLRNVVELAKRAADSSSTVLITGASGTGKELFAQSIHNASERADGPFISINCGALPAGLVESELFGYEGGSFTGAKKNGQMGKFELAHGGTLFLDEIGEMPLAVQASILRVLETKVITRIGGQKPTPVNVRIIAATNRDLLKMVREKEFREDLYYRLNVLRLNIPSLCERAEDIGELIDRFVSKYSLDLGKRQIRLGSDGYALLKSYSWPGNVRELENIIERLINISPSDSVINEEIIRQVVADIFSDIKIKNERKMIKATSINQTEDQGSYSSNQTDVSLKDMEKELITRVLLNTNGSMKRSAELLGIGRQTLYRKCEEYNIPYGRYR